MDKQGESSDMPGKCLMTATLTPLIKLLIFLRSSLSRTVRPKILVLFMCRIDEGYLVVAPPCADHTHLQVWELHPEGCWKDG